MYYCIENNGEVDVRAFRVMGMSSKEGSDKIGQFGTGNKYGISAVMREGLDLFVTSGLRTIKFVAKKTEFRGSDFHQIFIEETGKKKVETTMTVEMGKKNWTINEAMREFISNAIDEGGFRWFKSETIDPCAGVTRIYISASFEMDEYFGHVDKMFILDRKPIFKLHNIRIFTPLDDNETRIYRKGVQVYHENKKSKYWYEFDSLQLPESRLASGWDVTYMLGAQLNLFPVDILKDIVSVISDDDYFESKLYPGCVVYDSPIWEKVFEGKLCVSFIEEKMYERELFSKDRIIVPEEFCAKMKRAPGVRTLRDIMKESRLNGWDDDVTVGEYELKMIHESCKFLRDCGYSIRCEDIIVADNRSEDAADGQYFEEKLYINLPIFRRGYDEVLDTIAHEYFHHKSKSGDETRAFEDYLIKECLYNMKRYHQASKL